MPAMAAMPPEKRATFARLALPITNVNGASDPIIFAPNFQGGGADREDDRFRACVFGG